MSVEEPSEFPMNAIGLIANLSVAAALAGAAAPTAAPAPAPAVAPAPKAEILGIWKGTSVCAKVEGNEYCHDETVVYNVFDAVDQPGTVGMKAGRVIDDAVIPMYELYFTFRPETKRWSSEFTRPSFRGEWSYAVHGDEMTGTATLLPDQKIVRNVTVKRVPKEQVIAH
jgi:hypothetical protein